MDPGFVRVLAIVVLLCKQLPFSSSKQPNNTCPSFSQCGSFNLTFPFTDLRHSDCGLCFLDCTFQPSPRIAFEYPSEQWFIAKSTADSTVTLHSDSLQGYLTIMDCEAFNHEISLPNSPSISYTLSNNITFFRCINNSYTEKIKYDSFFPGFGYYGGCSDHIFYSKTPDSHLLDTKRIGSMCSALYLPYEKSFISDQGNKSDDDVPEVFRLLGSDYDIQWHVSKDCEECHRRGGFCPTDRSKESRCVNVDGNSFRTGKKKLPVILYLVGAAFVLLVFAVFVLWFRKKGVKVPYFLSRYLSKQSTLDVEALAGQCGLAQKFYSYSDIKKMTNSFQDEIGKGGYGTVYKGISPDGNLVAVKLLNSANGNEEDFINEVLSISITSHVNVVKLLGFCIKGTKRALVYEYMANGSLEKYIYSHQNDSISQLGIEKLYQISLGVARGLEYLHTGCNTRILHFDIKPHNILLDEDFCPKISDFGMAKQYGTKKESAVSSFLEARGTIGYIAPELINRCFGVVSYKSDVYSFGMMILEIVGRRKNVIWGTTHESEVFFPHWAYQQLIIDKDLRLKGIENDGEEDEIVKKIIVVGLWCIQKDPSQRPTMSKVIEMLEGNLQLIQIPPKPFFEGSSSSSAPASLDHRDLVSGDSSTLENSCSDP